MTTRSAAATACAMINILTPDGKLNDNVPEAYRGLTVAKARGEGRGGPRGGRGCSSRKRRTRHQVGHCYRCHTVIEPYLSDQWFVRMRPLADKALAAWEKGQIRFFPQRWENTYANWMREHPRLVHLAPAVVGPPHPRLVLREVRRR